MFKLAVGFRMKHLLVELHNQYIEALEEALTKPIELLIAAKAAAGNNISTCKVTACTVDSPCHFCRAWHKVWEDIDEWLKVNEAIG